jgi:trk system potassium uptake protein TrkA
VKIIILGAGQVGRTAAYHLSREEANDVTVVDVNEDRHRGHGHSGRTHQQ